MKNKYLLKLFYLVIILLSQSRLFTVTKLFRKSIK